MESSILQKKDQIIQYISNQAKIGKNVKIWHFAYVGDNTIIGDNVMIGSLAHIDYAVKIGIYTEPSILVLFPILTA